MIKVIKNFNKGFSLVEILVAISVFLVFVLAVANVTTSVSTQIRSSTNKERATILAEEGLEATRNIRDADFSNLADGTYGLSVSGNQWNFSGSSDVTGIFTRTLTISTISPNQKQADVTISWADQTSPTNSLNMSTYFTKWQSILNLGNGLTVNKTVVNHGGSKVAADFAPYKIGATTVTLGVPNLLTDGTYTVSETTDPNYTQTFSGDCDSSGSITMVSNPTKTCLITNEEKLSYLTVTKVVINHGGTKVASDFSLLVDSNPVTSGATNSFNSGVHTVSEVVDSNYIGTITGNCDSGGSVTLVSGATKSCTVTNEEKISPTVTTPTSNAIADVSATLGSNVTSLGIPASISARGTCWGMTASPTTNCLAEGGTTTGVFTQARTGFTPGTFYYYRGYATNATGTAYSADGSFTTLAPPTVTTTNPITVFTQTTATGGGNVTADGGATVTARGDVWDTAINPTIALSTKTSNGTGLGSFVSSLSALTCNTLYHVRAYATNSFGTSYGGDVTFTTSACNVVPTVTTPTVTSILSTTATLGSNVTSLGIPASISARGTCWGMTASPTTNCLAEGGTTTGVFTQARTGFTPGTFYYYRGYATNATGTAYSADGTFTPASTITFVGSATATGTTASIPTHNAGDLLVAFAYRDGNNTAPTIPAGWTNISNSTGGSSNGSALAYRIATGSDTGTGWSNATEVVVQVYRGISASPIGLNGSQTGSSTTVTYPARSLNVTNGSSWVIGFAGHRSTNTNLQNAPTGMTQRAVLVDATAEVAGNDTNGGVASWGATSVSVGGTSSGWMTRVLEIKSQ